MELLPALNGFEIPRGKHRAGPLLSEQISLLQQATSCYACIGGVLRVGLQTPLRGIQAEMRLLLSRRKV